MMMHLLTDTGTELGDTWVPDPTPTFKDGVTALRFEPISIYINCTGMPAWVLATHNDKPWNIFEVTFGQRKLKAGDTAEIDSLYMVLTPNINLIRRLYPQTQIEASSTSDLEQGGVFSRLLGRGNND